MLGTHRIDRLERGFDKLKAVEASPTLGELYGMFLGVLRLRAYYPYSSYDNARSAFDLSGQGRTLSSVGNVPTDVYNNIIPYASFDGSTQYYTRATEAGLVITSFLTVGGWFWADTLAANMALISKQGSAGNLGWILFAETGSNAVQAEVSSDGTATTVVQTPASSFATGAWNFAVLRYIPSTELAIFLNGTWTRNTTSIPASIFGSTAAFNVGGVNNGSALLDGRAALNFLGAAGSSDTLISYLYNRSAWAFQ
jgi:hypothetical protein